MKICSNYLKTEAKRLDDAAFPFYIRKTAHILANCCRPVDIGKLLRDMRQAISNRTVTIDGAKVDALTRLLTQVLTGRENFIGYSLKDIADFFRALLARYTIPRIAAALSNPEIYADWQPDGCFHLDAGHPDYIKEDCTQLI